MPLHDTADELCAVAKNLRLAPDDILLGAKATETTLKKLDLTKYRVIHLATHGTVASEIEGTSEPGLILTPPTEQTELDDGYLSASEVAALKLDADWVILSACNTADGGAQGTEASWIHAMLAMIDKGDVCEAHPAFWAPFVVVGEGA